MPKAKKLPSGSYRCQVIDHYEVTIDADGKKNRKAVRRSFTAPTRREAEFLAAQFEQNKDRLISGDMDVMTAIHEYIASKENVLSPTTVRGYRILERNAYTDISAVKLHKLNQVTVQKWMNTYSVNHSPKTCANAHGLLASAVAMFEPSLILRTKLPQRKPPELYTPTDADIQKLLEVVEGTEMEKAILLSAFGTLRRGEICGLKNTDIDGNVITIRRTRVRSDHGYVIKDTAKNDTSARSVEYPDFVIERLKGIDGFLVTTAPDKISAKMNTILKKNNLPHFRFHDLRAYAVSIAHALGVPDAYIQQWGGWKTDHVLKRVYRRAMDDKNKEYRDLLKEHFSGNVHTNVHTENQKAR